MWSRPRLSPSARRAGVTAARLLATRPKGPLGPRGVPPALRGLRRAPMGRPRWRRRGQASGGSDAALGERRAGGGVCHRGSLSRSDGRGWAGGLQGPLRGPVRVPRGRELAAAWPPQALPPLGGPVGSAQELRGPGSRCGPPLPRLSWAGWGRLTGWVGLVPGVSVGRWGVALPGL